MIREKLMIEDDGALLIGIDSASADLLFKWKEVLPTIHKLMKEGVGGSLTSTVPPFTPPAWTAILTGKNPGKTGILGWVNPKKHADNKLETEIISFDQIEEPMIWDYVGRKRGKSCVINVPLTYPARKIDGILVSGNPGHMSERKITYPPEIKSELDDVVNGYEIFPMIDISIPNREAKYLKELNRVLKKRLKATLHLLEKQKWTFFMVVFYLIDTIQHYFWHHMDETHPLHPTNSKYKHVIRKFYQKVDTAIGQILAKTKNNVNKVIVSDHGMGPLHGEFMINNFLNQNSFLKLCENGGKRKSNKLKKIATRMGGQIRRIQPDFFDTLFKKLPKRLKENFSVRGELKEANEFLKKSMSEKSTAYAIGEFGQIFLDQEKNREKMLDEIKGTLRNTVEKRLGRKLEIFEKSELYEGRYMEILPDLTYLIDSCRIKMNPTVTADKRIFSSPSLTGYHNRRGIFIAQGPNIKAQSHIGKYSIYDVTPTILSLLGIEIPKTLDGSPLNSILEKEAREKGGVLHNHIRRKIRRLRKKYKNEKE